MTSEYNKIGVLSGSTLKIIACILMAIDHIGLELFPDLTILRIIGRLAFPLFAFFIAEGCKYTKNRIKRFFTFFVIGTILFLFYLIYTGEAYGNIFLTFSVSIILIYLLQFVKKQAFDAGRFVCTILSILAFILCLIFFYFLFRKVHFEYDYTGMLAPVIISISDMSRVNADTKLKKIDCFYTTLLLFTVSLIPLSIFARLEDIQAYCFLSVPIIALYNGKPGIRKIKYLFYIFYPAHLILIEGIAILIYILNGG